eukprot:264787-Prymnesium_polylepis.3
MVWRVCPCVRCGVSATAWSDSKIRSRTLKAAHKGFFRAAPHPFLVSRFSRQTQRTVRSEDCEV